MVCGSGAFGRELGHKVGALMNRMVTLKEELKDLAGSLTSHSKKLTICESEKESSPRTQPYNYPYLGLPASRTVRNKCLLFKSCSLWYFVIAA